VSLETARSQLKAVLSKTGMSRQAQLVAALARLPVEYAPG
jgi:DNA-binding CsgD family transcriptional regulator